MNSKIQSAYDRCAPHYGSHTDIQRRLASKLLQAVSEDGALSGRVLDVGCGTGYVGQGFSPASAPWDVGGGMWEVGRKNPLFSKYPLSPLGGERVRVRGKSKRLPPHLSPLPPSGGEEIGFAEGEKATAALKGCPTFIGCDISFGMLSCAKNKLPDGIFYIQADAQNLPFKNSNFDLVVSNAAYQWISDLKKAFLEVRQILRPGGKFYFTVFNKNTLWQLQEVCRIAGLSAIASRGFTDKDLLSECLEQAGFELVAIEVFNYEKYYRDLWELLFVLKAMGANTAVDGNVVRGLGWRKLLRQANDLYIQRFGCAKGIPAAFEAFLVKGIACSVGCGR